AAQWLAEFVATFGLLLIVLGHRRSRDAAAMVAAWIGAAYWFTASTSFANPAAALGRMLSDSFAGIAPRSGFGVVLAQGIGAALGAAVHAAFERRRPLSAGQPNVLEASGSERPLAE